MLVKPAELMSFDPSPSQRAARTRARASRSHRSVRICLVNPQLAMCANVGKIPIGLLKAGAYWKFGSDVVYRSDRDDMPV